ncbi:zinc ribbon domain-containing protein [Geodermatophilus sp. SYSU D00691]
MPLYDYRCTAGHRFEAMASLSSGADAVCPCGAEAVKVPSRVTLGGSADAGRPMELMPQTWRGTYEGNREYLGQLRRDWGARQKLEEKYPELAGDRRPIIAHEGRYHGAPLRAGDPVPGHAHGGHAPGGHAHGGHTHSHDGTGTT